MLPTMSNKSTKVQNPRLMCGLQKCPVTEVQRQFYERTSTEQCQAVTTSTSINKVQSIPVSDKENSDNTFTTDSKDNVTPQAFPGIV